MYIHKNNHYDTIHNSASSSVMLLYYSEGGPCIVIVSTGAPRCTQMRKLESWYGSQYIAPMLTIPYKDISIPVKRFGQVCSLLSTTHRLQHKSTFEYACFEEQLPAQLCYSCRGSKQRSSQASLPLTKDENTSCAWGCPILMVRSKLSMPRVFVLRGPKLGTTTDFRPPTCPSATKPL